MPKSIAMASFVNYHFYMNCQRCNCVCLITGRKTAQAKICVYRQIVHAYYSIIKLYRLYTW